MSNVDALHRRLDRLKTLRQPHEMVWRDCFDHCFPIRGSGLQSSEPMNAQQALDRKSRLLHSAATDAGRTLAAALVSGGTPSSSVWGLLEVTGSDDGGAIWLDEAGKTLHTEIHASNFDAVNYEAALDMVGAGWFALYADLDRERGGFEFDLWSMSGVYAATSKAGGLVDTVFRCYTLTAEQCVSEFGIEKVSADTAKKYAETPDEPVQLCHAIYPRTNYAVGAKMARNLPIASCHFEIDKKHELRESGYHEMPVIVPRWAVIPGTPYAIGPMFDALPDARELNKFLELDKLNSELAVSGMWLGVDDGVLNPRTVKIGPRRIIVANDKDSLTQLSAGGDWHLADERIAQYTASIRKVLMADQLQPVDGPQMTATEVHVRVGMIRQLLGPIYGRLQAEYLAPLIERCFGLAYRAGVLGQAPASLGGQSLKVRYNNPLARAQKMEDVNAIERLNADLLGFANLAQVAPAAMAALDVIDFDENIRTIVDGLGVPLKNVRDADALAAFRDAKAKQQQAAQAQQQQQQVQSMAADAAMQRSVKAA